MGTQIFLGKPPANIEAWIKDHLQPAVAPSPYFTYDENKVITGLHQGEPNVWEEGIYTDWSGEENQYSGWTYGGGLNLVENYATAIGDNAFNDGNYSMMNTPPSKGITGNITFQNVISIGQEAFRFCNLTSITIPNVMSIKQHAFDQCRSLTSAAIGSSIQGIGMNAFNTCGSPITLTIGKIVAEVQAMGTSNLDSTTDTPYSSWGLSSGSTIVCTDGTITIE